MERVKDIKLQKAIYQRKMKGIDINMPIKGQFNYFKHFYL